MEDDLEYCLKNESYRAALEIIQKIESNLGLSSRGFWKAALCYFNLREFDNCINNCLRWNRYKGSDKTQEDKATCYEYLCESYDAIKKYEEAAKWGEKAVLVDKDSKDRLPWHYLNLSGVYFNLEKYSEAIKYGELAITSQLKKLNTNSRSVLKGLERDEDLKWMYYSLAYCYLESGDNFSGIEKMIFAAMMGRTEAIKYCIDNNIDYKEKAKQMVNR